jgi:hypothetical protein
VKLFVIGYYFDYRDPILSFPYEEKESVKFWVKGITGSFTSPLSYEERDRERSLSRENLQEDIF